MRKPIAKVAFVLSLTALGCVLVGQATDYWLSKLSFHQGLWRYCRYLIHTDGQWECMSMDKRADYESWILAIRILEIISAISLIGCLVVLFLYCRQEDTDSRTIHIVIALVGTLLAGATCLAGVTIYAIKKTQLHFDGHHRNRTFYKFDWSFALTCGGGAMALVCAMFMACELRKGLAVNRYSGYQSIPDSVGT